MPSASSNGSNGTAGQPATNRDRVQAFILKHRPKAVCAKCVSEAVGLRPSAVQRAATILEGLPGYERQHTACGICGNVRLSVRAAGV